MKYQICGEKLANIPWEDKPAGCKEVVWRSSRNPVVGRYHIPSSNTIFNSAVVPYGGGFKGVFRCDSRIGKQQLHTGTSSDGIAWEIDDDPIRFTDGAYGSDKIAYGYDPRVTYIDGRYYVTWCNWFSGPTIGVAYTTDFIKYYQCENAFLPCNRNGVLFPEKINGKYAMLSRPSDLAHTAFGDIFYSESPDMVHWGCHRHAMAPGGGWSGMKIGAGPVPIMTSEGWLLVFHGVICTCNGYVYKMGAAILSGDEPWVVKHRAGPYLMAPCETYECVGEVPNVVFPCAMLADAETGRAAIYYGGADTVVCVAYCMIDELIDFIKANDIC